MQFAFACSLAHDAIKVQYMNSSKVRTICCYASIRAIGNSKWKCVSSERIIIIGEVHRVRNGVKNKASEI